MIEITYGSREPPSLTIRGHSGYAAPGSDIVCAAVSTLFLTLVNSIDEYTNDLITAKTQPGDGAVIWRGGCSEKARLLLSSCLLGLRGIAEQYPDHVTLNID